jgi:hypothetical protein
MRPQLKVRKRLSVRARMNARLLVPIFLSAAIPLAAQSTDPTVYAESFRQGAGHIVEESFEAKLTPQDAVYRERIKDSRGADRYTFSIIPRVPEGDTKITSWQVKMADLRHPIYDNVLLASVASSDAPASQAKDALWRLDPSRFATVPVGARRIIKVESFYVVLEVKAYHFTPLDSPYLDSMTVAVEFRNTDPRQPEPPAK